jgi:hypothetical protein
MLRAHGYDFDWSVDRMLDLFALTIKALLTGEKHHRTVKACGLQWYCATRELGMSEVSMSKKLNIAVSTASETPMRGRRIVEEHGHALR